jgi:hypothetical protein
MTVVAEPLTQQVPAEPTEMPAVLAAPVDAPEVVPAPQPRLGAGTRVAQTGARRRRGFFELNPGCFSQLVAGAVATGTVAALLRRARRRQCGPRGE